MSVLRIYPLLIVICGCMFLFYGYKNIDKFSFASLTVKKIVNGSSAERLIVKDAKGTLIANISLPTSDLFDHTGQRQLHLVYVNKKKFQKTIEALADNWLLLNGNRVNDVKVQRMGESAVSITLPFKKLYILAPPHMSMAIRALKYERKNRQDIFSCHGGRAFCDSVRLESFYGMTGVVDRTLKRDSLWDNPIPRGRWVSPTLDLFLTTNKAQWLEVRYTMKTPEPNQTLKRVYTDGKRAEAHRLRQEHRAKIPGTLVMNDFNFKVHLFLHKGKNRVRVEFGSVTTVNQKIPMKISGVLMGLDIAPAKNPDAIRTQIK